jgi:uncharacterized protein (DUF2267 family)
MGPPSQGMHPVVHVTAVTEMLTIVVVASAGTPEDADLADRVRSLLGPTMKRLDLPRIHVMAEGRRVLLHGDVATADDANLIEQTIACLPEVAAVESHLHIGLLPGDSRPSQAQSQQSAMMTALLSTASAIGIEGDAVHAAVWGTLSAILEQIPPNERSHVVAHFPVDVVAIAKARRHIGDEGVHWKTELDLEAAAALRGDTRLEDAEVLVPEIIGVIRRFVPEEDVDVQATLTTHLRDLWQVSVEPDAPGVPSDNHR